MSRIGNAPVTVPKGVKVSVKGQTIAVKGPKGDLSFDVPAIINFEVKGDTITFSRSSEDRPTKSMHGMARAMTANMVTGCSTGFTKVLEIVGVGYRAAVKGQKIDLNLGFSHPVSVDLPKAVTASVSKDGRTLTLASADKALLGQVAADIRRWRPPEPYKGKGIRYQGETIIRKEGKARGKK